MTAVKYQIRRFFRMLRHKGLAYTGHYYSTMLFYANGAVSRFWYNALKRDSYPRMIEVETTTHCNQKCVVCEHTYWAETPRHMTYDEFNHILGQFPKLSWIGLTGIGEGFLNPDYLKMIKLVKNRNIYTEIYDTLFSLREETLEELIDLGLDRIIISMMGATDETYNKMQPPSQLAIVKSRIKKIIELKSEKGKVYPEITFHYIITKENINEAPGFLNMVRELLGNEDTGVLFSRLLTPFDEIKEHYTEIDEGLINELRAKADSLNIKFALNREVLKMSVSHCMEWAQPFIFVDGAVVPCCAGNEANQRKLQRDCSMGNIFEENFTTIWKGASYSNLRQLIRHGKMPKNCATCCLYEQK